MAFAMDLVQADERTAVLGISLFFIALWSAAAILFRKAAQRREG